MVMGCIAMILLMIICMPVVGIFMIFAGNFEEKVIGIAITIVGYVILAMFDML